MAKDKKEHQLIANPGDLGKLLIEFREKAGFSLVQMADALCLAEETIEKLENEEFDTLAEPPYIRGYLRNYAKIADSDPSELINLYEALRGADPSELDYHFKSTTTIKTKSSRRLSPVYSQLLFLILLVAVLAGLSMIPGINKWITETWNSFSQQTDSLNSVTTDNPLLTGTMPVPTPLPITDTSSQQQTETSESETKQPPNDSKTDTNKSDNSEATSIPSDSDKNIDTIAANSNDTQPSTEAEETKNEPETQTIINSDLINIKLVFNKEIWMRIRDKDNKTLFEATNSAGNEKVRELK